jgi:hypothetical protein
MDRRSSPNKFKAWSGTHWPTAKSRFKGKQTSKRPRRGLGWFGVLERAAREDYEARGEPPDLTEGEILGWADAWLERTGNWPSPHSGPIREAPGETWLLVAAALALGLRGLPQGSSIPRFLDKHRGRYNCADPKFTIGQVLAWADAWYERTGDWPIILSGAIPGAGGVNWKIVDDSLRLGRGMLPGGTSLCQLLARKRGVVPHPPFDEDQILEWADAHFRRTGKWPTSDSGPIADAPDETWCAVNKALIKGSRGLHGGSSLTALLVKRRQVRCPRYAPRLTVAQVLAWADAHHARTGRWPTLKSGPILEAPGELWSSVISAIAVGHRGFPGGTTFTRLLIEHRGIRSQGYAPRFSIPQILAWADAHHARNGKWPSNSSGPVTDAAGESWDGIDSALLRGLRGLPGGSSLARLLDKERGTYCTRRSHRITIEEILLWADRFKLRHGNWPSPDSGSIPEAPGETWSTITTALLHGRHRLPAGLSIPKLLGEHRGRTNINALSELTIRQILAWMDAYHERTGQWPHRESGPIPESPGDTWRSINHSLTKGRRGLPGKLSIVRLLAEYRGQRNPRVLPDLSVPQILAWVDTYREQTGQWPQRTFGSIADSLPGETWASVCHALKRGKRGLKGGMSLAILIDQERRGKKS